MGSGEDFWINNGFYSKYKNVCDDCFDNVCIKNFIRENADVDECDYCKRRSRMPIAFSVDEVFVYILESINTEWGDPNNEGVGWDSREGGYYSAKVISTDELYEEIDLLINNDELYNDFFDAFGERIWCQKNPHSLTEDKEWLFDWERFCNQIKYETRFVFYQINKVDRNLDPYSKEPYEILDRIAKSVTKLNLIQTLPKGTNFFRVRTHKTNKGYNKIDELGPPLPDKAVFSNRMSPAGIPLFYGANDLHTALAETYDNRPYATYAEFSTMKDFKVLDLTQLPKLPDIYCVARRHLRKHVLFIESFLMDFVKPIKKDRRVHIEYVPTQIVTEFLKSCFKDQTGDPLRGILYPSSRVPNGVSCVLFFNSNDCCQDNNKKVDKKNRWLMMLSNSVKTIKL